MTRLHAVLAALVLGLVCESSLSAQNIPFQLFIQDQSQNISPVGNGATLTVVTNGVGQPVSITLIATYQGASTATLGQPQLIGPASFTIGALQPVSLTKGQSATVQITFTPSSSQQASAQLTIPYTEAGTAGSGVITATLVGTAPLFSVSYALPSNQNVLPLADGSTLTFPSTPLQTTSAATVQILNTGSGSGLIQSIQVTGPGFAAQSIPLLPGSLQAKTSLQFPVLFSPQQVGPYAGKLQIVFADHTVNIALAGTGVLSIFSYQLTAGGHSSTVNPGDTLNLPSTDPGNAVPFSITVQNSSDGPGTITGLTLAGNAFQSINPPAFPQTLPAGGSLTLSFVFTPSQAGIYPGTLRIGGDTFLLRGSTSGGQLNYSYTSGSNAVTVFNGGTLFFSPVPVGQSSTTSFTITNSGTNAATINSIFIPTGKNVFTLTGVPSAPVTIQPNTSTSFNILFAPTATGTNTGLLQIDGQNFTLSGPGASPPALPSYQFQSPGGVIAPLQQPSIGLTLGAPYPVDLTGTLTIVQTPLGFSSDPSVQFSTGGVTVTFAIPAGQTHAIFQNNSTTVKVQTGSIAGQINIVPTFSTSGGVAVTPVSPTTLQFTVPASAPQLLSVQVVQSAAAGFTLQVIGLSPSRTLTGIDCVFTAAPSFNLASTKVSLNIATLAGTWFQSGAATVFGSQFTITIPFILTADTSSVTTPRSAIQSVSVTATNDQGVSNALTTQVQ